MRFQTLAAFLLLSGLLLGCREKEDPKLDSSQTARPTKDADPNPKTAAPNGVVVGVDIAKLLKVGPGDPALTYEVVKGDPAKHRGKRVTWAFLPLSSQGRRVLCGSNTDTAIDPRATRAYVVEFASEKEAGDAFRDAFPTWAGYTVTATVAGLVDQSLVGLDGEGIPQMAIAKVTVPLLVYPTYKAGQGNKGKGKG